MGDASSFVLHLRALVDGPGAAPTTGSLNINSLSTTLTTSPANVRTYTRILSFLLSLAHQGVCSEARKLRLKHFLRAAHMKVNRDATKITGTAGGSGVAL